MALPMYVPTEGGLCPIFFFVFRDSVGIPFFFPSSTLDFPYNPVAADVYLHIITTETEFSFLIEKKKLSSDL